MLMAFSGPLVASCWRRQKLGKKLFGSITFLSRGGGGASGGDELRGTGELRGLTAGESTAGAATGGSAVLAGVGATGAGSALAEGAADLGCADSRCAGAGGSFAAAGASLGMDAREHQAGGWTSSGAGQADGAKRNRPQRARPQ